LVNGAERDWIERRIDADALSRVGEFLLSVHLSLATIAAARLSIA
jgi:hypothetical protein